MIVINLLDPVADNAIGFPPHSSQRVDFAFDVPIYIPILGMVGMDDKGRVPGVYVVQGVRNLVHALQKQETSHSRATEYKRTSSEHIPSFSFSRYSSHQHVECMVSTSSLVAFLILLHSFPPPPTYATL